MKRLFGIFLIFIFLVTGVFGLSVELTFPVNNAVFVDSNTFVFKCKATGEDLRFIELYTNVNGWGKKVEIINPSSNIEVSFSVKDIINGDYLWNCKAIDGNEGIKFASSNRSFSINIAPNNAPTYKGGISAQSWNMNTEKKNAFDLDNYFSDQEGTKLSYSANGNDNILVNIDSNNVVSFSQPSNWFGTEKIYFAASDGKANVNSDIINLTVVKITQNNPIASGNIAPVIEGKIPDQNVGLDTNTWFLDLIDYGKDTEDSSSKLNWYVDGVNIDLIKVEIDNVLKRAKFTSQGKTGTDTITFVVSDSGGLNASQSLKIIIKEEQNELQELLNEIDKIEDSPFVIKATIPPEKEVIVNNNEIMIFKIETTRKGDVEWYLDGELLGETRNFFSFNSNEQGEYNLTVYVTDLDSKVSNSWNIIVKSAEPKAVIITSSAPVCGNNIVEGDENCLNCPSDVLCLENQKCDNSLCVEKKGLSSITGSFVTGLNLNSPLKSAVYGILGLFGFFLLSVLIIRRKNKKKYSHLTKLEKEEGFVMRLQKRLREWIQQRAEKSEQKLSLKNLESKSKDEILQIAPSSLSIIRFIKDSVAQGHPKNIIKKALKEKGWSRFQIWKAFRKI